MSDDEKRRDNRERVTLFVEYEGADDLIGEFTENLSSGGTVVATSGDLPLGLAVVLGAIAIGGSVRRNSGPGAAQEPGADLQIAEGPVRKQLPAIAERIRSPHPKTVSRTFPVPVIDDNKHVAQLITDGLRGS